MLFNLYRRVAPRGRSVVVVRLMSVPKGGRNAKPLNDRPSEGLERHRLLPDIQPADMAVSF
jgi:hypothetical protein